MEPNQAKLESLRRRTLVGVAVATTLLFLWMIRDFLLALILAAILSAMFHPMYRWFALRFRGRRGAASGATVLLVALGIILPALGLLAIVGSQAIEFSRLARPWVEQTFTRASELDEWVASVPALDALRPYRDEITTKLGELAGTIGGWAVTFVTAAARETASFLLLMFVALYSMYFFLIHGRATLAKIMYYLPLPPEDEARMIERFVSVARATIKGTIAIAVLQGTLGGLAFWVLGLDGAALWGTVMAVLSAIPGLGHAIVWLPAVVYLGVNGEWGKCIALLVWCGGIVGSVDNFLRPWLVGKDTKMPDLLILLSTLGGLLLFGAIGFILGPIVAALFVTVWDLYGAAFRDLLPPAPETSPSIPPSAPKPGAPPSVGETKSTP